MSWCSYWIKNENILASQNATGFPQPQRLHIQIRVITFSQRKRDNLLFNVGWAYIQNQNQSPLEERQSPLVIVYSDSL